MQDDWIAEPPCDCIPEDRDGPGRIGYAHEICRVCDHAGKGGLVDHGGLDLEGARALGLGLRRLRLHGQRAGTRPVRIGLEDAGRRARPDRPARAPRASGMSAIVSASARCRRESPGRSADSASFRGWRPPWPPTRRACSSPRQAGPARSGIPPWRWPPECGVDARAEDVVGRSRWPGQSVPARGGRRRACRCSPPGSAMRCRHPDDRDRTRRCPPRDPGAPCRRRVRSRPGCDRRRPGCRARPRHADRARRNAA